MAPRETNSSISTVGRRAPSFSLEGKRYKFKFLDGCLAFEVTDAEGGAKVSKKLMKKNWVKYMLGIAEVDKVVETEGDCESLTDLIEQYIHNSDDVEGPIWLLSA